MAQSVATAAAAIECKTITENEKWKLFMKSISFNWADCLIAFDIWKLKKKIDI